MSNVTKDWPPKDMILPISKTCLDCIHFASKCSWLLSREGNEVICDWSPSRFKPKLEPSP